MTREHTVSSYSKEGVRGLLHSSTVGTLYLLFTVLKSLLQGAAV